MSLKRQILGLLFYIVFCDDVHTWTLWRAKLSLFWDIFQHPFVLPNGTSIRQVPEFGTSVHYGKAHGSSSSGWMLCNYTWCCWPSASGIILKLIGRDRSWTGDNAACGRCHLAHAAWFAHIPYLLPESWREYPARTSLVSPLHTGVVSRHARATLIVDHNSVKGDLKVAYCFVQSAEYWCPNGTFQNAQGLSFNVMFYICSLGSQVISVHRCKIVWDTGAKLCIGH